MNSNRHSNARDSISHGSRTAKRSSLLPDASVSSKRQSIVGVMSKSNSRYFDFSHRRSTFGLRPGISKSNSKQVIEKDQTTTANYLVEPQQKFNPEQASRIIYDQLSQQLKDQCYNNFQSGHLTTELSKIIQREIQLQQKLTRYKIVTMVWLGQKQGQSTQLASRCLWNQEFDNYASATFTNGTIFATGLVFAVYVD